LYNLEATPAEGTTYRFAREDKKRFPNILQAGTENAPYYTNSSQMPVGCTDDPFAALEHQEPFQQRYTGGTVFHLYMGEPISSPEACKKLVRMVLTRFRIPYITITPTFSICPKHGYLPGEHAFCPRCDKEKLADKGFHEFSADAIASLPNDERQACEIWTRVMGYHRPVSQFNRGKQSEFRERRFFSENKQETQNTP